MQSAEKTVIALTKKSYKHNFIKCFAGYKIVSTDDGKTIGWESSWNGNQIVLVNSELLNLVHTKWNFLYDCEETAYKWWYYLDETFKNLPN